MTCRHFIFCAIFPVLAIPSLTGADAVSALEQTSEISGPLIIGGDADYPPNEFLDKNGQASGFSSDITRAVAREAGLDVEIVLGPWSEMVEKLDAGEIDALQGMFYSTERDRKFDFSQGYIHQHCVSVLRSGEGTPPYTAKDFQGLDIAVQRNDIMHSYANKNNLGKSISTYDSLEDALRSLLEGKHDCVLGSRFICLYEIGRNGWEKDLNVGNKSIAAFEYCFAVKNGRDHLLAALNEGLRVVKDGGEYRRIFEKWYGQEELGFSLRKVLIYLAWVAVPLLAVIVLVLVFNASLRRMMNLRNKELLESENRYRSYISTTSNGVFLLDGEGGFRDVNPGLCSATGYSENDLCSMRLEELGAQTAAAWSEISALPHDGKLTRVVQFQRIDGSLGWWKLEASKLAADRSLCIATDISEQKEYEKQLAANYRLLLMAGETANFGGWSYDVANRELFWSDVVCRIHGLAPGKTPTLRQALRFYTPESRERMMASLRKCIRKQVAIDEELKLIDARGREVWVDCTAEAITDRKGNTVSIQGSCQDATELKHNKERIENLNRVLYAIRNINQLIVREKKLDVIVKESCNLLVETRGYKAAWMVLWDRSGNLTSIASCNIGDDKSAIESVFADGTHPACYRMAQESGGVAVIEREEFCGDSELAKLVKEPYCFAASLKHEDTVYGMLVVNISQSIAEDEAERELFSEIVEDLSYAVYSTEQEDGREKAETALREAQKMESIGRLAGGIAHDFNNMLMVIINFTKMCQEELGAEHRLNKWLQEILDAATRSASLTKKLLGFARKQSVIPKEIDLNDCVSGSLPMLANIVGEGIQIEFSPGANLWKARVDPHQIDQILTNICLNSRAALSDKGKIDIATANASISEDESLANPDSHAGEYLMISVTDNGRGMDEETLDHIFEPFFTTKPIGEASGLGLATVYGIVRQNRGFVEAESEPGKGAKLMVYLPRYDPGSRQKRKDERPRVLLVEDERAIRKSSSYYLNRSGYETLAAENATEALKIMDEIEGMVDILVTDVMMPDMNGNELAKKLRRRYPEIKVLFMSGYAVADIFDAGGRPSEECFLQKPFSPKTLIERIEKVLAL